MATIVLRNDTPYGVTLYLNNLGYWIGGNDLLSIESNVPKKIILVYYPFLFKGIPILKWYPISYQIDFPRDFQQLIIRSRKHKITPKELVGWAMIPILLILILWTDKHHFLLSALLFFGLPWVLEIVVSLFYRFDFIAENAIKTDFL